MDIKNLTPKQIRLINDFLENFIESSDTCQSCCFCDYGNTCFFASVCILNYLQNNEYNFFKKNS